MVSEEWVASDLSDSTRIPPLVCVSLSFCLSTQPPIFLVSSLASSFGPASPLQPQLCWLARGCCWKSTPDTVLPRYLHYIRLFMVLKFHSLFLDFKTSSLELLFSNYQGKPNFAFNISFGTFYTCYLIARINTSIVYSTSIG